ncbi:P-loop containing nucleoside triphosphate hydrolase protein [Aspergillus brunneoviolaceus CBS 621.78]|uniref:P-loop containing nucleoside triphosphate hydrolase protein n=1 Tax=Aspergillus brunneoviolaceus CBS 621.78 TaxID=1450534 RepID=A0ACD1GET4_9EURO|nr:P-loop containing nucleoside triphosphate hydrolase protein [Aspergillus brunneoviolaceus CBS 621.78]RAH47783.1 P-loop containing nucleoside triphosphate hydrolase protein [Aspergillus brunneoviolaceus CBS 621.78]
MSTYFEPPGPWNTSVLPKRRPVTSVGPDFTPIFEDTVLSLLPSALLLLILPYRIACLHGQQPKVLPGGFLRESKFIFLATLAATHLALLIFHILSPSLRTPATLPESAVTFVASLGLCLLSRLEHTRSVRPSAIINGYILLTLVFDAARVRSLFRASAASFFSGVFSSMIAVKVMVLLAEAVEKRQILLPPYRGLSPEETSGIYSRSFFFWLNQLMISGFHSDLQNEDLYPIDKNMSSQFLQQRIKNAWNMAAQNKPRALFWTVLRANLKPFLYCVLPRLVQIGFRYTQPLLLTRTVSFANDQRQPESIGWGLTGAFFLVLLGVALSNGVFYHMTFRFVTSARGSLISFIYAKTLDLDITALDESIAVTLMSSDVQSICNGLQLVHDLWAVPLELAIVVYLLAQEIKMAAIAKLFRRLLVLRVFLANSLRFLAPPITLAIYALGAKEGQGLNVNSTYSTLSLISLAASPVNVFIRALPAMNTALASLTRIQEYLQSESRRDSRIFTEDPRASVQESQATSENIELADMSRPRYHSAAEVITARDVSFSWNQPSSFSIHNINLSFRESQFYFIIGPVGCGKSTLVKGILGETPSTKGLLHARHRETAFVDQTPWICNMSFRDNVVGASRFTETWYHQVVSACGLDQDVAHLPHGHATKVGSSGISLSGGQKQRLALARAVYARKRIVILDDVLSGIDLDSQDHIMKSLFANQGLFRRLGTTVIMATHSVHNLSYADYVVAMRGDGSIAEQGTLEDLEASGGYMGTLRAQYKHRTSKDSSSQTHTPVNDAHTGLEQRQRAETASQERTRQSGDWTLYLWYFGTVHWASTALWMSSFILEGILPKISEWLVNIWMGAVASQGSAVNPFYLGLYSMSSIITAVSLVGGSYHLLMFFAPRSAERLHERLLNSVMHAPLSFFTSVDTGTTVNRFSQDMTLVDHDLPYAVLDFVFALAGGLISAVMICISTRYFAAVIPPLCLFLWMLQKFYLRTSRQMRLLDLEAKSPLFSQFLETLSGLMTIRAFGWASACEEQSLTLLDGSQRPFYLLFCIQRWLELALDLSVAVLGAILMALVVKLRGTLGTGYVGLAILNVITFSQSLSQILRNWADLETSIGAIARIRDFVTHTPSEDQPGETVGLAEQVEWSSWPSRGAIEFQNVCASYTAGDAANTPVLRNLSLSVQPGQKIGICGRSGSGKSSLLAALFRLLELDPRGRILIDDVDIARIPRQMTRDALNAIPQDTFFTHGTIRTNLDPGGRHSHAEVERALRRVGLWAAVQTKGGVRVALDANAFSHGERQLLCLARALLRKSRVVVLDEVSSNVDVVADARMQRVIREDFAGCTVLAVAHRLETIRDFDRIAVMHEGHLVEFDTPEALLSTDTAFRRLYQS